MSPLSDKEPQGLRFLWWNLEGMRLPRSVRALIRSKTGIVGILFVLVSLLAAILAPILAPHDPYQQNVIARLKPPAWEEKGTSKYPLGTDQLGRDVLSRLIYGARISLVVAAVAVLIAAVIGVAFGLIAGFFGGWIDQGIMGLTNFFLSFPYVLLAIAVMGVIGPGFSTLILVLGLTSWPVYTRIVRSEVLRVKELEFVDAARVLGVREGRILVRHILPNVTNSVMVTASLETARMIINEAFFSFLGLGVQPPIPSWGTMLNDGKAYIFVTWWLVTFPGLAIFIATLGINLIGDWLRDLFDPHMVF